jgi:hypothetical protein
MFGLLGVELGPLVWILGVVAGIATAILTLTLNLQKYVVIIGTGLLGASGIVGTIILLFNPISMTEFADHPVKVVFDEGVGWSILLLVIAAIGIAFQFATTQRYEVARYNRWVEHAGPPSEMA